MKNLFLAFLLSATLLLQAQIINTESMRIITDTNGWVGQVALDVNISKNTRSSTQIKNNIHIQYKTKKNLFIFINKIGFQKVNNAEFNNKGVQHLRYNYMLNSKFAWELFLQNQYNALYKITFRELLGIGSRIKLTKSDKYKVYLGSLLMYEYEKNNGNTKIYHSDWRNSSYLSFRFNFTKHLFLTSTTYYQPKIIRFSDYRMSHQSQLNFKITKNIFYKMALNYSFDSFPVSTVPNEEYHITNGIVYKFK